MDSLMDMESLKHIVNNLVSMLSIPGQEEKLLPTFLETISS